MIFDKMNLERSIVLKTPLVAKMDISDKNILHQNKLGNRFHSFTAKCHIDAFIERLSSLICAFGLER